MRNTLVDLNNHLFAEIERLGEEDLKGEDLKEEIKRADAIAKIGSSIIENANTYLRAASLMLEYGVGDEITALPQMLEFKDGGKAS